MNAFSIPERSMFAPEPQRTEPISPQLAYYRRTQALGIHPRQLRKAGLLVLDRRFKANKGTP